MGMVELYSPSLFLFKTLMKTIFDVEKIDNKLTFKVSSNISIINSNDLVICIDECTNSDNIFCDNLEVHNYVFDYTNSIIDLRRVTLQGDEEQITSLYYYEITIVSDTIQELDGNMKYIKVYITSTSSANDYIDGIYYDPEILYNAELGAIRNYCSTCLDDLQMQTIMLVVHYRQLMEQAITISHNKEALQYYKDLCRLLRVSTKCMTKENNQCSNGMCSL